MDEKNDSVTNTNNSATPNVQENTSHTNVVSETVIDTDAKNIIEDKGNTVDSSSIIQEVSVNVNSDDFNNLNPSDVSASSIFNKQDNSESVGKGMKEGEEYNNQKKGFPYFMVIIFVIVIIMAFFIDDIVDVVDKYLNEKPIEEEQNNNSDTNQKDEEKSRAITLDQLETALLNSNNVTDFEKEHDVKLTIVSTKTNLKVTTTNYLSNVAGTSLVVDYDLENDVLLAICDLNNSKFGLEMSKIITKEIAILQGLDSSKAEEFINNNLYTNTIDKGFEFTNSEDSNNTYRIATNIKIIEG